MNCHNIWASTRNSLTSGFANNKGADLLAHPRRLISAFVIRFLESNISKPCYKRNSNFLNSLCSCRAWFESGFAGLPEDRFCCVESDGSDASLICSSTLHVHVSKSRTLVGIILSRFELSVENDLNHAQLSSTCQPSPIHIESAQWMSG